MFKSSFYQESDYNIFNDFSYVQRKTMTPDVVVDETWFSDPVICKEEKVCIHAIQ
jgi:hypothetical protein